MAMTNIQRQQKHRAKIKAEREALKNSVEQAKYNELGEKYACEIKGHWLTQKKLWETEKDRDWYKAELEKAQKNAIEHPGRPRM